MGPSTSIVGHLLSATTAMYIGLAVAVFWFGATIGYTFALWRNSRFKIKVVVENGTYAKAVVSTELARWVDCHLFIKGVYDDKGQVIEGLENLQLRTPNDATSAKVTYGHDVVFKVAYIETGDTPFFYYGTMAGVPSEDHATHWLLIHAIDYANTFSRGTGVLWCSLRRDNYTLTAEEGKPPFKMEG